MIYCVRYNCFVASCLVIVGLGCQAADELNANTEVDAAQAANLPVADVPRASFSEPPAQTVAGGVTNDAADSPTPAAIAQFSPPFPERLELFEPPKRAQNATRQSDVEGQSVELKGFVNVDRPRVLLAIDGVISPIAEGGEKYGVQVISIQPPSVVLQRGRSRWTATLE